MLTATKECRLTPRETLSEPVLVRPCDSIYPEEICRTANVSRSGLYFTTPSPHYFVGMNIVLALNFRADDPVRREQIGDVVRVEKLTDKRWGVAVRILLHSNPGIYSGT